MVSLEEELSGWEDEHAEPAKYVESLKVYDDLCRAEPHTLREKLEHTNAYRDSKDKIESTLRELYNHIRNYPGLAELLNLRAIDKKSKGKSALLLCNLVAENLKGNLDFKMLLQGLMQRKLYEIEEQALTPFYLKAIKSLRRLIK